MPDKIRRSIILFGILEICIGATTLIAVIYSLILGVSRKPPAILAFVLITSITSLSIGIGILKLNRIAYYLLLYFSTVIILSKVLIFSHVIILSGALETIVPSNTKDAISIIYHTVLLFFLARPSVKKYFSKSII